MIAVMLFFSRTSIWLVIPAKAGIQQIKYGRGPWIPLTPE